MPDLSGVTEGNLLPVRIAGIWLEICTRYLLNAKCRFIAPIILYLYHRHHHRMWVSSALGHVHTARAGKPSQSK